MMIRSVTRFLGTLLPAVTLALTTGIQAHAKEGIHYIETFRNYSKGFPLAVDTQGLSVGNDPIHNQTSELNVNRSQDGAIFKEYVGASEQGWQNVDVAFQFVLRGAEPDARKMTLLLRTQSGDLRVTVGAKELQILAPNGNLVTKKELPFELKRNVLHTGVIKINKGMLQVYLDDLRVMKEIASVKIPDNYRLTGVNVFAHANAPFALSELVVRDPAPLPDRSLANTLPLPRKLNPSAFKQGATVEVPANDLFGAMFLVGNGEGVKVTFVLDGTEDESITFKSAPYNMGGEKTMLDRLGIPADPRPDSIIQTNRRGFELYIKPLLRRYRTSYSYTDTYVDVVRDWDQLPKASETPLKVELRRTPQGADFYLNGRFVQTIQGNVKGLRVEASANAAAGATYSQKANYDGNQFLPLDIPALARARAFAAASASIQPGWTQVKNIPMLVAAGAESADVGLTKVAQGNWALEVDEYTARSPFNGYTHEIHFSLPNGIPYNKAWVLCAVDPDDSKDPILTTRLARYIENGAGKNRTVDTIITLPRAGETPGEGIQVVGKVSLQKNGAAVEVPLYLVEVPIRVGEIIDFAMESHPLNFEFIGKPWINLQQIDKSTQPDKDSTSAVQIFGVTLEKAPVALEIVQSQPGNVFHNDEVPETTAVVKALHPTKGSLSWEILDIQDQQIASGSKNFELRTVGAEQRFPISLKVPQVGWYRLLISVKDAAGNTLFTHPASFAQLGKDQRKAKYDSPYGIWWFDGAHITPSDINFAGPIMFKAGIRKATWTRLSEKEMAPWFITKQQINSGGSFNLLSKPDQLAAQVEKNISTQLAKYPHATEVMIFHESGHNNIAPELIGDPVDMSNVTDHQKRYAEMLNISGKVVREKFPNMTLVVGNSNSSQGVIAEALRYGGNPDYIDYIGIETPSQSFIPEKLQENTIQGIHLAQDTAKIFSGRTIPMTGSYEFTYRTTRDLGPQRQAEWYVRDMLLSLSNDFLLIGPAILFDANAAYYNFYWGGSGILERGPWGYPKPSYVAYATLTNVMDQVKFSRQIPTGSTTVYAVEFNRSDKKRVTALWAARGNADFNLSFNGDDNVTVVEMYGTQRQENTKGGKLTVAGGTAPVYVVSSKEIQSISLSNRTFPEDAKRNDHAREVAQLAQATLVADNSLDTPRPLPLRTGYLPIRQAGKFDVRQVNDEEKGTVLELELKQEGELNKYITEYAVLKLDTPAAVEGSPDALGVWVKGNSNWGRIMFEIEDANGEIWRSIGTGGWGCDVLDWPGDASVNFDGWNFVSLPLRRNSLFTSNSPGPVIEQWVSDGGNKQIDYPIKVRSLIVEMNRTPINLIDFVNDNKSVIRLQSVHGIYAQ